MLQNTEPDKWHPELINAIVLAEKVSYQQSIAALTRRSQEEQNTVHIGQGSFESNFLEMVEAALLLRWAYKRNFYKNMVDYGLEVMVQIEKDGVLSTQSMPFFTLFHMIDKIRYESPAIKWWPSNFSSSVEFKDHLRKELEKQGVIINILETVEAA